MRILFGEYRPDQPAHLNIGAGDSGQPQYDLLTAEGCFPIANGYAPLGQFSAAVNGTLASACFGAGAHRADGVVYIFAANADDIYRYQTSGYTSVKSGLSTTATAGMRFCSYNDLLLMTNGVDAIQQFDPSSPSATSDLSDDAPTARFLGTIGGFVIAAYAADDPLRVDWSSNGDPTGWTAGTLDAGSETLSSGGDTTGFVGGEEYGLLFQESRIIRMVPSFDDAVFDWQEISKDIGCIAPWSLAPYGKLVFFLSNKGFMVTDGVTVEPIGNEKIDRTFLSTLDRTYLDNISAVVDPRNSLYMVMSPSANPPNAMYLCQFALGYKWTRATAAIERMFSSLALGTDIEGLDAIYSNLDSVPVSLDSALFKGGFPLVMAFDGSHNLGGFNGANMAATFRDGLKELFQGSRARITSVRPLCDAPALTVTLSGANDLSDNVAGTDYTTRSGGGFYRTRKSFNLSQVTLSIAAGADWSFCQGYDIDAVQGGRP